MHSNSLLSAVIEKKFFQEYFLRNVELLFTQKLPVIEQQLHLKMCKIELIEWGKQIEFTYCIFPKYKTNSFLCVY